MKRTLWAVAAVAVLLGVSGCGIKVTKPVLQMMLAKTNKVITAPAYADSLEKRIGVPYVEGGTAAQVVDIYYAPAEVRKDAVLVDIHGGFYVYNRHRPLGKNLCHHRQAHPHLFQTY